ncbi:hypothetical protein SK128_018796 [Halocaridina rubra]|uniref:Uncharacterized protein n=1 Tax=Halocaridina rubra TaxID=373956 RepID=A0AAN8WMW7_HALRR
MDFGTHEDGGGGKKKGLARLAKTSSLSNLENLSITEKNENVDEHYSFTDDFNHKKPHPDMQQHSCSRTAVKHSGSVNLLPNKINFSALSGQNFDGKTEESSISEYSSLSLPSHLQSDPCSDTEFLKTSKSTTPEKNIANQYDQASVSEKATEASLFAHESHLSPPLIKRSSSMTYLTEAFSHVHNIFMFPAHAPVVADGSFDNSLLCLNKLLFHFKQLLQIFFNV